MARASKKVNHGGEARVRIDQVDEALRPASQMRESLDAGAVAEYAGILEELPPVRLVWGDGHYWVADGAHTITAAREAGREDVRAIVATGSYVDAYREASRCNGERGVRLREGDKAHRIREFLGRPEASGLTQQEVADVCNVSQQYVSRILESRNPNAGFTTSGKSPNTSTSKPGRGRPRKPPPEPAREHPAPEEDEEERRPWPRPAWDDAEEDISTAWSDLKEQILLEYARWPEDCRMDFARYFNDLCQDIKYLAYHGLDAFKG